MNEGALRTLEFHKILEQLKEQASSELGQERCLSLHPHLSLTEIENAQTETKDALERLLKNSSVSFYASGNIYASLQRLDKGSSIHAADLLQIARLLENTARIKSFGRRDNNDTSEDSLDPYFSLLEPLNPLCTDIRRCILSEDEISDDASPALRSIRRHMKQTVDRIHSQLTQMVGQTYRNYLQDAVITMRDGRYCIPVKSEYKNNVPGMIHDQSSSASTFFIEPAAVVNLNNELRELELQEAQEIERIIAQLSSDCADHLFEIRQDLETIAELDFIFAKGKLALAMNATKPIYNTSGRVLFRKARHPLLPKDTVVPIDLSLGDTFDLLIITGPNTGGKTVALKTLGLLALMGQAGLHIPAADRSELSIFSDVFADIGDEQSIEQSLSTFSSHMKRIVSILENADEQSLCLFDELGAGTDPTEGAMLAIAILNTLHERHIRTVATTHYSELKIYAIRESGVMNASCEFDVETLRPTYRLLIGVPGKSNAFAISRKLGLSEAVIEDAGKRLNKKDEDLEDVLSQLDENRLLLEQEKETVSAYRKEAEDLKVSLEAKQDKWNDMRERILQEARDEAREILQEAKKVADEAIRYYQKHGGGEDIREMESLRKMLREKLDETRPAPKTEAPRSATNLKPSDFHLGDDIRIVSMDLNGTVSSIPDAKGNLFVQCGIMRMQTNINDVELIKEDKKSSKMTPHSYGSALNRAASISSELSLIGLTVDEALAKLDKYLDDAYMSHLSKVRIVHGKGTGALRSAVHSHLKKISYVKSYQLAEYGEGDAGVTIVEFK
ncbi:MAG: endonuclease MutS2 [Lachnospiraceae bacterium]|nr:endonuclease MutS2 [Lachnospiraceae bacterium]